MAPLRIYRYEGSDGNGPFQHGDRFTSADAGWHWWYPSPATDLVEGTRPQWPVLTSKWKVGCRSLAQLAAWFPPTEANFAYMDSIGCSVAIYDLDPADVILHRHQLLYCFERAMLVSKHDPRELDWPTPCIYEEDKAEDFFDSLFSVFRPELRSN